MTLNERRISNVMITWKTLLRIFWVKLKLLCFADIKFVLLKISQTTAFSNKKSRAFWETQFNIKLKAELQSIFIAKCKWSILSHKIRCQWSCRYYLLISQSFGMKWRWNHESKILKTLVLEACTTAQQLMQLRQPNSKS